VRDFTWHVFTRTGDIEAYLLYKEMSELGTEGSAPEPAAELQGGEAAAEPASS
jgi:hypothetical protein